MAFCPNCGRELAEGEVCNCTPATEAAPVASQKPSKKTTLIFAAVIAVVVLIIVAAILSPTAKTPIKKLTKAFNKQDSATLAKGVIPKKLKNIAADVMGEEEWADYENKSEMSYDIYFENLLSQYEKWSVKIKFKEKTELSADYYQEELRNVGDSITTLLDWTDSITGLFGVDDDADSKQTIKNLKKLAKYYSKIKISKVVRYDCVVTVKADGNKEEKEVSFTMGKVNGKWAIISFNGTTYFDKASNFNKYLVTFSNNQIDYIADYLGY